MQDNFINGVNVENLNKTKETLKEKPELAKFKFMVKNTWINANHSRGIVREFFQSGEQNESRKDAMIFDIDEPEVLLGENKGPNPVEYVLLALSGCLTSALSIVASSKGIHLKSVESQLEGNLDVRGFLKINPEIRNGYQEIRVTFKIESDASEDQIKELVQLAQQTSPVFDIVTNKVPVAVGFERK